MSKWKYHASEDKVVKEPAYEEIANHDKWDEVHQQLKDEGWSCGSEYLEDKFMKEHSKRLYELLIPSMLSLPAHALKGKFPDGAILEEGKDFLINQDSHEGCRSVNCTCNNITYAGCEYSIKSVTLPLPAEGTPAVEGKEKKNKLPKAKQISDKFLQSKVNELGNYYKWQPLERRSVEFLVIQSEQIYADKIQELERQLTLLIQTASPNNPL